MKYDLLSNLLPHLDRYESAFPKTKGLQHFAVWLARELADENAVRQTEDTDDMNTRISELLMFVGRYLKTYARKALEDTPLATMDDFAYLIEVEKNGPLSKMDIIQRHRHEKPSGMEIIKRLTDAGLLQQTPDPGDRRSVLMHVTDAGKTTIVATAERMKRVSRLGMGQLSNAEKMLLLQLLDKLEDFHHLVQAKTRGGDLASLLRDAK